jgi:hypothetical protein
VKATLHQIPLLETWHTKRAKLLCFLSFLLRCGNHNIIPQFLKLQHQFHTQASRRMYRCMSFALLCKHVHYTQHKLHKLDEISCQLLGTHLQLAAGLPNTDWTQSTELPSRMVLMSAQTTILGNAANSSKCTRPNTLPQPLPTARQW